MELLAQTLRTAVFAVISTLLATTAAGAQDPFLRGDISLDGNVDITDAIAILNCHFYAVGCFLPCEDAGDVDDSGAINIADAVFLLGALFLGDRVVPPPGLQECGLDPTPDTMPDCAYGACPSDP